MTRATINKPTLIDALKAIAALAAATGDTETAAIAGRAWTALGKASGKTDASRVEVLVRAAPAKDSPDVDKSHNILTIAERFIHIFEPKAAGARRWELVREAMAAAARNPKLVEDIESGEPSSAGLIETYVARLTDESLSLEDFPMVVEELLADPRLKAADQRKAIMRVTGAPPRRLGSIDNRRIELISWRRARATDDRLFKARADEKRRF